MLRRLPARSALAALLAVALAGCGAARIDGGMPVAIAARPVPLPGVVPAPGLRLMGAVALTSPDHRFGGLSSLRWSGGWLHALSDENGTWYALRPAERNGRLVGIAQGRVTHLTDSDGAPLEGKRRSDAEAMELVADPRCGGHQCAPVAALVALERDHRILRYAMDHGLPAGTPERLALLADWFHAQPDNEGIEAMASDGQGTLLVSEGLRASDGGAGAQYLVPALGTGQAVAATPLSVPADGAMRPSELVALAPGRFILLRRSWTGQDGFAVNVEELVLSPGATGPIAHTRLLVRLAPPVVSENFEGAAIRREHGHLMLYIVSDDNFEPGSRTMLVKWALPDPAGRRR